MEPSGEVLQDDETAYPASGPTNDLRSVARRAGVAALLAMGLFAGCQRSPAQDPVPSDAAHATATPPAPSGAAAEGPPATKHPRPASPPAARGQLRVIEDVVSPYSHVQVLARGTRRALAFVQSNGSRWTQTEIDLRRPHEPVMPYLRGMMVSLAYVAEIRDVLIVGLGGGAGVHVLRHRLPEARIVGVEIDPEVVRLAKSHFRIAEGPNLRIVTDDALRYVPATADRFDLVWMDVFLEPSAPGTNASGIPEATATVEFLRALRRLVRPHGVVAFNLHHKTGFREHLAAIEQAFDAVHVYAVPDTGHRIVIAGAGPLPDAATLSRRAARLDQRARAATPPGHTSVAGMLDHRIDAGLDPSRVPDPRIKRPPR
ncbi:MAG: methyltransferase domain-containing protein [Deltaproteobacteria bacterium]|nr:MAG: methyltransferase domain-containing protein [Deltaproteobacteria bacterium]